MAKFIGETNLLPVTFEKDVDDQSVYYSETMGDSFYVNKTDLNIARHQEVDQLSISIRPEVIHISEGIIEGKNVYQGKVSLVQFTGEAVHTYVKINETVTIKATDLNRGPKTYLKEGSQVNVYIPEDQVRIVPQSGVINKC
ncbi:TOBE domain-containing protein [Paracerasibacillus soli]|uniref:TOBE domain-containing protein n=1 Tax=Paracerasibacillus soli TaxID=480284 RepID=A0ABU5CSF6_9BACI|nr:TOBE domain-containing protein [Virgibacillus soli]MDY0409311.1 TOBE domain-containing protein [Virgibacillus soli]